MDLEQTLSELNTLSEQELVNRLLKSPRPEFEVVDRGECDLCRICALLDALPYDTTMTLPEICEHLDMDPNTACDALLDLEAVGDVRVTDTYDSRAPKETPPVTHYELWDKMERELGEQGPHE